jgi:hypothetical protein
MVPRCGVGLFRASEPDPPGIPLNARSRRNWVANRALLGRAEHRAAERLHSQRTRPVIGAGRQLGESMPALPHAPCIQLTPRVIPRASSLISAPISDVGYGRLAAARPRKDERQDLAATVSSRLNLTAVLRGDRLVGQGSCQPACGIDSPGLRRLRRIGRAAERMRGTIPRLRRLSAARRAAATPGCASRLSPHCCRPRLRHRRARPSCSSAGPGCCR